MAKDTTAVALGIVSCNNGQCTMHMAYRERSS